MNKRLIAILVSLAVVVVLVVLSCVVFTIGAITVQPAVGLEVSPELQAKIIADSKIVLHGSIFGLSEEKATANIEYANPEVRVIDIERKAPNTVCINIAYRTPLIAVTNEAGDYALLDRDLKVIRIVEELQPSDWVCLWNGTPIQGMEVGAFVPGFDWLIQLFRSAESVGLIERRFGAFFTELRTSETTMYLKTNTGVTLCVYKNGDTDSLLRGAYNAYLQMSTDDARRTYGYLALGENGWMWSEQAAN